MELVPLACEDATLMAVVTRELFCFDGPFVGFCVLSWFCVVVLCAPPLCNFIEEERAGCFTLIV